MAIVLLSFPFFFLRPLKTVVNGWILFRPYIYKPFLIRSNRQRFHAAFLNSSRSSFSNYFLCGVFWLFLSNWISKSLNIGSLKRAQQYADLVLSVSTLSFQFHSFSDNLWVLAVIHSGLL
jgi:hypothetical protein